MVLGMAMAVTPLTQVVCSTIFYNNMVQPLVSSGDPYNWKVRDAHAGVIDAAAALAADAKGCT